MVEKSLHTAFIVTCSLGLVVVLDLFQLHVHSVIPCLCSLPTEPSPDDFQLGDYVCARDWHSKIWQKIHWFISVSYFNFGGLAAFLGGWDHQSLRGDGTGYQQTSISKTVLPDHASWNIGLLDAQEWLQRFTFDGYCDEQLYSVHPLPSCTTISINALFDKSVNHNHI